MTVITITRGAKCSDCMFLKWYKKGKLTRHFCNNINSSHYKENRRMKDLVCDDWKL